MRNNAALLKLADLLDANAANPKGAKFDLGVVAESRFDGVAPPSSLPVDCGTVVCAIGLACLSGEFADLGLTYEIKRVGFNGDSLQLIPTVNGGAPLDGGWRNSVGMNFYLATKAVFGLTEKEVLWLFTQNGYDASMIGAKGERKVAVRIRNFVAGTTAPHFVGA